MEIPSVTLGEIEKYLKITGKKGQMVISALGKMDKYFDSVMSTEIGQNLLEVDIFRMEDLLQRIIREEATQGELAEFRYLRDARIPYVVSRIQTYIRSLEQIKKVSNSP
jgi:hypothetical protein